MAGRDGNPELELAAKASQPARRAYDDAMTQIRAAFERDLSLPRAGATAVAARADAVDRLVCELWDEVVGQDAALAAGLALVALGGYGRRELFFYSDLDLMFLQDAKVPERNAKDASGG